MRNDNPRCPSFERMPGIPLAQYSLEDEWQFGRFYEYLDVVQALRAYGEVHGEASLFLPAEHVVHIHAHREQTQLLRQRYFFVDKVVVGIGLYYFYRPSSCSCNARQLRVIANASPHHGFGRGRAARHFDHPVRVDFTEP